MAPSLSPLHIPALDVHYTFNSDSNALPTYDYVSPHGESASSGTIVVLGVLLVIGGFIFVQRRQHFQFSTIRGLYTIVYNFIEEASPKTPQKQSQQSGVAVVIDESAEEHRTYDSSKEVALPDEPPKPIHAPSKEVPRTLPPQSLCRKHNRTMARQKLRIMVPAGVAVPDVELVTTAALPSATPTSMCSAISATRAVGAASRRNTARTPRSGLCPSATAASTVVTGVVHRKVEVVYQSNGWAPATVVYLSRDPRDATVTRNPGAASSVMRKRACRSLHRVPSTAITPIHAIDFSAATVTPVA